MLPLANNDSEEEYNIIEDEDADEEGNSLKKKRRNDYDTAVAEDSVIEEQVKFGTYNPLKTLIWWKGQSFESKILELQKATNPDGTPIKVNKELEILAESSEVIEGNWRRLFEIDMREDELDFTSKVFEQEAKELAEEIGELAGLDDDLFTDSFGFGSKFSNSIGANVFPNKIPTEWTESIEFYKDLNNKIDNKSKPLKGGKKYDQSEFDSFLRELESESNKSMRRSTSSNDGQLPVDIVPETVVNASAVSPIVEEVSVESKSE